MTNALSNNRGFTLIEVLVAMVIMLVGVIGLLQTVNVATEHNLRNLLRDEAVRVADIKMREFAALPFDDLNTNTTQTINSAARSSLKSFVVTRQITDLPTSTNPTSRRIDVTVQWSYRGQNYSHRISRIVAR